jgi:hypothetical protein
VEEFVNTSSWIKFIIPCITAPPAKRKDIYVHRVKSRVYLSVIYFSPLTSKNSYSSFSLTSHADLKSYRSRETYEQICGVASLDFPMCPESAGSMISA